MSHQYSNAEDEINRLLGVIQRQNRQNKDLTAHIADDTQADTRSATGFSRKRKASTDAECSPSDDAVIDPMQQLAAKELSRRFSIRTMKDIVSTANSALGRPEDEHTLEQRYMLCSEALQDISAIGTAFVNAANWEDQAEATRRKIRSEDFNTFNPPSTPRLGLVVPQPLQRKTMQAPQSLPQPDIDHTPRPKTPLTPIVLRPRDQSGAMQPSDSVNELEKDRTLTPKALDVSTAQRPPKRQAFQGPEPAFHSNMLNEMPFRPQTSPESGWSLDYSAQPRPFGSTQAAGFPSFDYRHPNVAADHRLGMQSRTHNVSRVTPPPVIYTPQEYLRRAEEKAAAGLLVGFTDAQQLQFDIMMGVVPDPKEHIRGDKDKESGSSRSEGEGIGARKDGT